jgi:hypothetical protein
MNHETYSKNSTPEPPASESAASGSLPYRATSQEGAQHLDTSNTSHIYTPHSSQRHEPQNDTTSLQSEIFPLTGSLSNLDAFLGPFLKDETKTQAQDKDKDAAIPFPSTGGPSSFQESICGIHTVPPPITLQSDFSHLTTSTKPVSQANLASIMSYAITTPSSQPLVAAPLFQTFANPFSPSPMHFQQSNHNRTFCDQPSSSQHRTQQPQVSPPELVGSRHHSLTTLYPDLYPSHHSGSPLRDFHPMPSTTSIASESTSDSNEFQNSNLSLLFPPTATISMPYCSFVTFERFPFPFFFPPLFVNYKFPTMIEQFLHRMHSIITDASIRHRTTAASTASKPTTTKERTAS